MTKVLITGATGYIGRRLKEKLLTENDVSLRLFVRNKNKVSSAVLEKVDVIEGDTFDQVALTQALKDIDVAYYLIHSMAGDSDFEKLDRQSAENFRDVAINMGVKRLIYLGGLGVKETASSHLLSRIETGEILSAYPEKIQTIWFRAGVIIGAGSASFEIIRNLVQKLPLMITPSWVKTKTQPIGVDDVITYLESALTVECEGNMVVDIGAKPLSFKEMMEQTSQVMGLKRLLFPVPFFSPKLSSYWLVLFTPIPFKMASALVEGLKSETLVINENARKHFGEIEPKIFTEAVQSAIEELEKDQVLSRWCDSSSGLSCDVKGQDDTYLAILRDVREIKFTGVRPEDVFSSVCRLGGREGWQRFNVLWRLRGLIDKLFGGYGVNRGRRSQKTLRVGDALDFWKVADLKENKRLLLFAQMKLPGKAWLEFDIRSDRLVQTAHFLPRGVWGRLYWYAVLPLHHFVFKGLIQGIIENAKRIRCTLPE